MKWEYNREDKSKRRICHCDNPCTTSSCGRMIYVYPEKNLRAYPGVERGSKEWDETYKVRWLIKVRLKLPFHHRIRASARILPYLVQDCGTRSRVLQLPIYILIIVN